MTIALFVSGRADLGPMAPVLAALTRASSCTVRVLTAVGLDKASAMVALAEQGIEGVRVSEVGPRLSSDSLDDAMGIGGEIARRTARALVGAEALVVLGDRWELPFVIMPAVLSRVVVVHIQGGEVTGGAIDERVRHAVTKLSDIHCVAANDAKRRLMRMGEPSDTVFVTGAPGLDRYAHATPMPDAALRETLGRVIHRPFALFTYHPVTTEPPLEVAAHAAEALMATAASVGTVVMTDPGPDPGYRALSDALRTAAARLPNVIAVHSAGAAYPSMLAACDVVVGNSSSGVIEAAFVNVPAVDIGSRQAGRMRAASVVHAEDGVGSVSEAIARVLAPAFPRVAASPYGDGRAADRIANIVLSARGRARPKQFADWPMMCPTGDDES